MKYKRPVCPVCGLGTVYTRIDGSVRCMTCGHDTKVDDAYRRDQKV